MIERVRERKQKIKTGGGKRDKEESEMNRYVKRGGFLRKLGRGTDGCLE